MESHERNMEPDAAVVASPVHVLEGGVNRKKVGSVCHPRSQRKQPVGVLPTAFRPGATSAPAHQPHRVASREGQEAIDRARCSPPRACDQWESEARLERLRAVTVAAESVPTTHLQTRRIKFSASSKW